MSAARLGGLELGGTKCVAVVGDADGRMAAATRVPTTTPDATLSALVDFFAADIRAHGPLEAIGIGSFGPVDLAAASSSYGHITSTPKPGWRDVDVVGVFRGVFGVPIAFDTDVNAAAVGEWRHGAAQGLESMLYLTVGTGIGGGALVRGRPLHGLLHPEMGHVRIPHDRSADPFRGTCPFHGDCLEGLASGPAMAARWKQPAESLPADHAAWRLEAHYLALALHGFVCTLSPERIVVGGGVAEHPSLLPLVRAELLTLLNGYVQTPSILEGIDGYVVPPALGDRAGVIGALVLADSALGARG